MLYGGCPGVGSPGRSGVPSRPSGGPSPGRRRLRGCPWRWTPGPRGGRFGLASVVGMHHGGCPG
eukprot:4162554-Alexandrium_andersonii.AAC.1